MLLPCLSMVSVVTTLCVHCPGLHLARFSFSLHLPLSFLNPGMQAIRLADLVWLSLQVFLSQPLQVRNLCDRQGCSYVYLLVCVCVCVFASFSQFAMRFVGTCACVCMRVCVCCVCVCVFFLSNAASAVLCLVRRQRIFGFPMPRLIMSRLALHLPHCSSNSGMQYKCIWGLA